MNFEQFKKQVDKRCWEDLGCSIDDLPDYPLHDDYETLAEDLSYVAPEDVERKQQLIKSHVGYTIQDITSEVLADSNLSGAQGIDY